jgi:TPR repeat protein
VAEQPGSSRSGGVAGELSAEEIFRRFASRILFLTCETSSGESALASGVLVSADGFIVTNAHVVGSCRKMAATYINGAVRQSYEPVLKSYDEQSDTAVIKIAADGLDFFGVLTRPVQVGERVYAIGNPRGLEQSISEGIVSGNREEAGVPWIQHSAPISPGSSGGALISSRGELLGINSWTRTESQNLNFAVPAAMLARALSSARTLSGFLDLPPNAEAQFNLGERYSRGDGVTRDDAQAARWFRKAAEQGNALAQTYLGAAYELGSGVPQDHVQAAAWYRKGAEQGNAKAQGYLGRLYSTGDGVPKDYAEAAKWHRKAAEQGNADSQIELGALYQLGQGVPKDDIEAYFWIKVASSGEFSGLKREQVTAWLDFIAKQMTTTALSQVQERAHEWLAEHATNRR